MPVSNITPPICPLCDNFMRLRGDYYVCTANVLHQANINKEWQPYADGSHDKSWLKWRMKVRMGRLRKMAHKEVVDM